jgi:hypothetical protein
MLRSCGLFNVLAGRHMLNFRDVENVGKAGLACCFMSREKSRRQTSGFAVNLSHHHVLR